MAAVCRLFTSPCLADVSSAVVVLAICWTVCHVDCRLAQLPSLNDLSSETEWSLCWLFLSSAVVNCLIANYHCWLTASPFNIRTNLFYYHYFQSRLWHVNLFLFLIDVTDVQNHAEFKCFVYNFFVSLVCYFSHNMLIFVIFSITQTSLFLSILYFFFLKSPMDQKNCMWC